MNETAPSKKHETARKKRRRCYDAEFKKAAIKHGERHGGELSGRSTELGLNDWTLRDGVEAARA